MPSVTDTESEVAVAETTRLDDELSGLDALEVARGPRIPLVARTWAAAWPKLAAIGVALAMWQLVVWLEWRPRFVLPPPADVAEDLWDMLRDGTVFNAAQITLWRAAQGYLIALVLGIAVGLVVSRNRIVRAAIGSFITGLQTMPSIVWFPFAILLFGLSESAIAFVVVLGAAPAIANGLIAGVDSIPPLYLRAGRVLGARRLSLYRHIVMPASLPSFVGGLKQGWAFAWRSLMAGEMLVVIAGQKSIGFLLQENRSVNNSTGLLAVMVIVLFIGLLVDAIFGVADRRLRRRWGLIEGA